MSRWEPDPRDRLVRAALDLFTEQGFTETTVPQITARAGLTTRTFFRHFPDKREVLFAHEEHLPALVAQVMADAPAWLSPMTLISQGLRTVAATQFEGRREYLRTHRAVVQADEGLRERELRRLSILSEAVSRGFRNRGVDDLTATLAAHIAVTTLTVAVSRWLDQDTPQPLPELIDDTLTALRSVAADRPIPRPAPTPPPTPTASITTTPGPSAVPPPARRTSTPRPQPRTLGLSS